jgi:hypothetical protein
MGCGRPVWMYHQKNMEIDVSPRGIYHVENYQD